MKLIIFKIGHFPFTSETFVVNHIVETIKMGFEVRLLVQELVDKEMSKYSSLMEKYKITDKVIKLDYGVPQKRSQRLIDGIKLIFKNFLEIPAIIKYYRVKKQYNLTVLYEWAFFRKFRNAALFHVQYGTNSKPLGDLKKSGYFKMPVIVTFHGHDSFFPISGYIPKEGYYDNLFETAELFTANTPYLKKLLIDIDCPIEKIRTIPLPVDTSFFLSKEFKSINQNDIQLLSVGRLEKIKGHHLGIEAVNILVNKGYKITYKIIGDGSCEEDLKNLIDKYDLTEHVFLLGALSQKQIIEYYWGADIFLMTSTVVHRRFRETQGLVSLEAQACGCPVVGFKSGGVAYTVKDQESGFLVEEENVLSFSQKVEDLINDDKLFKKMVLIAPRFVKDRYSTNKIAPVWKEVYEKMINN